jgi:hypothetical protein
MGRAGKKGGKKERRAGVPLGVGRQRDGTVGKKGVVAVRHHKRGEALHDWLSLQVKVAEHLVGAPATEEADEISVDARDEKSHRAGGTKALGCHIGG